MLTVNFSPKSKVLWSKSAKVTLSWTWPSKELLSSLYFELQCCSIEQREQKCNPWDFTCSCPLPHLQPLRHPETHLPDALPLSPTSLLPPAPAIPTPNIPAKAACRHFLLFLLLRGLVRPQILTKHIYWSVHCPQKACPERINCPSLVKWKMQVQSYPLAL